MANPVRFFCVVFAMPLVALSCCWGCAGTRERPSSGSGGVSGQAGSAAIGPMARGGSPASAGINAGGASTEQPSAAAAGGEDAGLGGRGGNGGNGAGAGTTIDVAGGGAGGAAPRPPVTAAPGATLVKLNPALRQQTFEGWGTSLCWWANNVGGWAPEKRNALVDLVTDPVKGLGYNVFRYNIGGGENPAHTHMDAFKAMPGFERSDGSFDFSVDENQRAVLLRIAERGTALVFEAFSNSPPYWMTTSGCASGNSDGSNNLKPNSYDAFADYLAQVVKHYRDAFGIKFRSLEALNEPNASWWKANGGQEGCHFSPANQQTLIQAVSAALQTNGLTDVQVSASDENSIDDAYNNIRAFEGKTLDALGQINVHSYAGSRRAELRALATDKGKRLWQSESGPLSVTLADDTEAALFMAGRIISDLKDLQPEAWIDWQVADPAPNWASFAVNNSQQSFTFLKRFYMHAGFSRYIRPGATFIRVDSPDMVLAQAADGSQLTLVIRNGDKSAAKTFTFDLTPVPSVGAAVEVHRTSRNQDLVTLTPIQIAGFAFSATMPANSVTTLVIPLH